MEYLQEKEAEYSDVPGFAGYRGPPVSIRITDAQARKPKLPKISEAQFQAQVLQLAKLCGWSAYHTFDSRRSHKGFPDLILTRVVECRGELLALELKRDEAAARRVTAEQMRWIEMIDLVPGCRARLCTPADWAWIEARLARPERASN